MLLLTLKIK